MRRKMTSYPIGSTWKAIDEKGNEGTIWLQQRGENLEMWMWSCKTRSDWNPTYKMCREEIPLWNTSKKKLIFRRIK